MEIMVFSQTSNHY